MDRRELSEQEERDFIIELTALTKKYGICISGCGCCGSPSLEAVDVSEERAGYIYEACLEWVDPRDQYNWETHSDHIIK